MPQCSDEKPLQSKARGRELGGAVAWWHPVGDEQGCCLKNVAETEACRHRAFGDQWQPQTSKIIITENSCLLLCLPLVLVVKNHYSVQFYDAKKKVFHGSRITLSFLRIWEIWGPRNTRLKTNALCPAFPFFFCHQVHFCGQNTQT